MHLYTFDLTKFPYHLPARHLLTNLIIIVGTEPEINQGRWLGFRLDFWLDLSYIVSIT